MVTGSKNCSILATDVETGSIIARLENAHENAINSLISLTKSTVASGDDEGCIKVWDNVLARVLLMLLKTIFHI